MNNFKDFLEFAKSLPNSNEINNRNAASRAYYTAYHGCIQFYNVVDGFVGGGKGGCHEQLIKYMEHSNNKSTAFQMIAARKLRVSADYKLDVDFTKNDREQAIMYADRIISSLKK